MQNFAELGVYNTLSSGETEEPVADKDVAEEFETETAAAWRSKRQIKHKVHGRCLSHLLVYAGGDSLGAPVELPRF